MLRYAIVTVIADVVAFGVGAHWGILGIAVAYAITTTLIAPLYFQLAASSVGLTAFGFLRELSGIMQASVLTGLVALGTREALLAAGAGPAARLVAGRGRRRDRRTRVRGAARTLGARRCAAGAAGALRAESPAAAPRARVGRLRL